LKTTTTRQKKSALTANSCQTKGEEEQDKTTTNWATRSKFKERHQLK